MQMIMGGRTYVTVLESADECGFVDDFATGRVDNIRALLESTEFLLAYETLRLLLQRCMYTEHVRLRQHLVEPLFREVLAVRRRIRLRVARVIEHTHREAVCEFGETATDSTHAEDGECE